VSWKVKKIDSISTWEIKIINLELVLSEEQLGLPHITANGKKFKKCHGK